MTPTSPALSTPMPIALSLPLRPASERFETLGSIGVGGMAQVLRVRDRALGREVALKVPATDADGQRIEREALVLARLDHPSIVPLFDSGRWDGEPWLAMRLVRGSTLARAMETPSPGLLRHVLAATEAMAHAHSRGYVHRDLKPANIMVGELGETQVIDWGLALAPDLPPLDGPRAGTASAMSPEQHRGEAADPRSDVWALGTILGAVAAAARVQSPELTAIVARATDHAPLARYADARELAEDLGAFLEGRRVAAYTYRPVDLLRRTLVAWRRELIVALVFALALAIGLWVAFDEVRQERARSEQRLAVMLAREATQALHTEDRARAEIFASHADTLSPSAETRGVLAAVDDSRPAMADLGIDLSGCDLADLSAVHFVCRSPAHIELRTGQGTRWRVALDNSGAALLGEHVAVLTSSGVTPLRLSDGTQGLELPLSQCRHRIARARGKAGLIWGSACGVRVSDDHGFAITPLVNPCPSPGLRALGLDPSADRVISVCHDGSTFVGATRYDTGLATDPAQPLAFSVTALRDTIAIGESHGDVVLIDLKEPRRHRRHRLHEGLVRELLVSPGQRLLAMGDVAGPALFDPALQSTLWRFPSPRVTAAFDGDHIVIAGAGVQRWDMSTVVPRALDLPAGITAIAVSADGSRAAIGSGTHLQVVDTTTRRVLLDHRWQDSVVSALSAIPGSHDFIAHGQGALRIERVGEHTTTIPLPNTFDPSMRLRRVVALADGDLLLSAFGRYTGRLGRDLMPLTHRPLVDLATDPLGISVVALDEERYLLCGPELVVCGRDLSATAVATADPARFATARTGSLATFDFEGHLEHTFVAAEVDFLDIAIARRPDGVRVLAGAARDGSTWLFNEDRPTAWAVLRDHEARVSAVALDPQARFAIVGGWDGRLVFWPMPGPDSDRRERAETTWGFGLSDLVLSP